MAKILGYKKILWAVDAFQPDRKSLGLMAQHVALFAREFNATVDIVYSYRIPPMLMDKKSFTIFQEPYIKEAKKNLDELKEMLASVKATTTVVANRPGDGKSNEVSLLLNHARKTGADLIAVATHGRGAIMKFFIGSFAESLLMHCPMPLLVIGPHLKPRRYPVLRTVTFPTDFSRASEKKFRALINEAAAKKFRLHLVNGVINEFVPLVISDAYLMGGFYPVESRTFKLNLERNRVRLNRWLSLCKRRKVAATGDIYGSGGMISDIIAESADKRASDLIVMVTRAARHSHEALGSVTRKTLRKATAPVLALRH